MVRGRVTKEVKWLRWIQVQCTNVAVRHDPHLKRFYPRLRRRKGHKIAIVTTDKKMLVCIHHVPRKGERYNPN